MNPVTLDYRLADTELQSQCGVRWEDHLRRLTEEQLKRFYDPDSSFEATHFIWDYSQVEEE